MCDYVPQNLGNGMENEETWWMAEDQHREKLQLVIQAEVTGKEKGGVALELGAAMPKYKAAMYDLHMFYVRKHKM